jgi:hypothetical protein
MEKNFIKYFVFLVLLVLMTNCKDEPFNPSNSNDVILPLALGNNWQYFKYEFSSSDKDSIYNFDTVNVIVKSVLTHNQEKWYDLEMTYNSQPNHYYDYVYTNKSDGLWFLDNPFNYANFIIHKYPTIENDTIIYENWRQERMDTIVTISTAKELNVPAGKFTCYYYFTNNTTSDYFCPGVGKIKFLHILKIDTLGQIPDTLWYCHELMNYKIK